MPVPSAVMDSLLSAARGHYATGNEGSTLLIVNSLIVSISLARPALSLDLSYINLHRTTALLSRLRPRREGGLLPCQQPGFERKPSRSDEGQKTERGRGRGGPNSIIGAELGFGGQDQVVFGRNKSRASEGRNGIEGRKKESEGSNDDA